MNFISEFKIDTGLCDRIVEQYHNSDNIFKGQTLGGYDPSKKLSFESNLTGDELREYYDALQQCLNKYMEQYPSLNDTLARFGVHSRIKIQMYPPTGGYFVWHCERTNPCGDVGRRLLVFMTYLNDVEDGGETEFLYQNLKVKPEKGKTLIWPSEWTHTHRGLTSKSESKFIVTGWFEFDPDSLVSFYNSPLASLSVPRGCDGYNRCT